MARETDLEERERKDQEKVDANLARQKRLGQLPTPADEENDEGDEAPKSKSRARSRAK